MASLNHLIGWDWHLQSRVSQHLHECRGPTCCHTDASRSNDSRGAVFLLWKENSVTLSKVTLSTVKCICSHISVNGRLGETPRCGWNNIHVQPAYTFPPKCTKRHPWLSTSHNFTRLSIQLKYIYCICCIAPDCIQKEHLLLKPVSPEKMHNIHLCCLTSTTPFHWQEKYFKSYSWQFVFSVSYSVIAIYFANVRYLSLK